MKLIRLIAVITAMITIINCRKAAADDYSSFDAFIEETRKQYNIPGVSVAIVKDDQLVFIKGYGVLENGKGEAVNPHTLFQLASVSKTFTAASLGVLVDKGKMKWNDEIITHLPDCVLYDPYSTRFATAIDLLAHRTGLPAFGGDLLSQTGYSRDEILFRGRYIAPGKSFREQAQYSNFGFFIAGELAAKLGNGSFEKVVENTLLTPLKMTETGFANLLDGKNVASAHARVNGRIRAVPWDRSIKFAAAGGVVSSAMDMAKWMRMFLNRGELDGVKVLSPETVDKLFEPAMVGEISFSELPPISVESGFSYNLGWGIFNYKGDRIIEKGGGLDGMRSLVTLIPAKRTGIVILSNLNLTVFPEFVRAKFLAALYGAEASDMENGFLAANEHLSNMLAPPAKQKEAILTKNRMEAYTGVYANPLYGDFTISQAPEGDLTVSAGPGEWKGKLSHFSNDTFLLTWPLINYGVQEVTFTLGPNGKALSFTTETLGDFNKRQNKEKNEK